MNRFFLLTTLALVMGACSTNNNEKPAENAVSEPIVKERWINTTVAGIVTNIVKETREITLMGSEGNLVSFTASDAVERFDEIKVGDRIAFDYLVYMKAEFREPTAEELAEPLKVIAEVAVAPEEVAPAGVLGAMVQGVVTIEVLNRPNLLAVVKGPKGNYLTIAAEDPAFLETLHIGQKLILTYAEAIAVSLTRLDVSDTVEAAE
ncbi:MAG: hypothetical protein IPM71_05790 [Bacteroidota bacterium]|nr:MAG: hypothetical protein IPM71_05790 [Bacteroidota bacterium]